MTNTKLKKLKKARATLDAMRFHDHVSAIDQAVDQLEFQQDVQAWCVECFGETTAADVVERNWRFLEEALELVQSLGGAKADALGLVDYVFSRDLGDPKQETGGVMVTLAALCAVNKIDMSAEGMRELNRIQQPEVINRIRTKHANKPHRSALPGDYKHGDGVE